MRNFQDTFETRKRLLISAFSICMTVPLSYLWFLVKPYSRIFKDSVNVRKYISTRHLGLINFLISLVLNIPISPNHILHHQTQSPGGVP